MFGSSWEVRKRSILRWTRKGDTMDDDDDKIEHQTADFIGMGFVFLSSDERYSLITIRGVEPSKTVPGSGITAGCK